MGSSGSHITPSGFQAKPVNTVARSHSVTIQAAANSNIRRSRSVRPQRHASPAAAIGKTARYSDNSTTAIQPSHGGIAS